MDRAIILAAKLKLHVPGLVLDSMVAAWQKW